MKAPFLKQTSITLTFVAGISLFSSSCTQYKSEPDITQQELLEGAPFPEKRDFPLSQKIKPCDDFYEYVCQETIQSFKLPEDRSRHIFSFSDHAERLLYAKKKFLAYLESSTPKTKRRQELKDYFQACMDGNSSAQEERQIIASEFEKISKIHDRSEFIELLKSRIFSPKRSLVSVFDNANLDNPKIKDIVISAGMTSLPEKTYYQKKDVVRDLESLAKAFFTEIKIENPAQKAQWLIEFEKLMAKEEPLPADMRQRYSQRNYKDRSNLKNEYKNLGIETILGEIPEQTKIRDIVPETMLFADRALSNYDLEKLKAVYLFHSLSRYMDDAYPDFFKKIFDFNHKHLGGPPQRPDRNERCTREVMGRFSKEIDAEMIPILFKDFPESKVTELAESVRTAIINGLKSNQWLSEEGKKGAIQKMISAQLYLVKPKNDREWDFNPEIDYNAKTPYENRFKIRDALTQKMLAELSEERRRERWYMGPLTVNAYYVATDNKFTLLQGILQPPFYDPSQPIYVNLGSIGAVTGHELGHGIDDEGAKYDSEGRLHDWLTESDRKEFKKRGDLFIERFNKRHHDGKLTLGENIGDHVGLTFSYQAAFPNNTGTQEQKRAFFVQYARAWCGVMLPKLKEMVLKTNPHALGEARTNEQVLHQNGFYEAFECKKGDPMYLSPEKRIHVW